MSSIDYIGEKTLDLLSNKKAVAFIILLAVVVSLGAWITGVNQEVRNVTLIILIFTIPIILMGIGHVWIVILAFKESTLSGLGVMFIPFRKLIYIKNNWEDVKIPALLYFGGFILFITIILGFLFIFGEYMWPRLLGDVSSLI